MELESARAGGLLVVRRIYWLTVGGVGPPEKREPAIAWPHDIIAVCYRGFEGEAWPDVAGAPRPRLELGLASSDQYDVVMAYYQWVSKVHKCDLMCLHFLEEPSARPSPPSTSVSAATTTGVTWGSGTITLRCSMRSSTGAMTN